MSKTFLYVSKTFFIFEQNFFICEQNFFICEQNFFICEQNLFICEQNFFICEQNSFLYVSKTFFIGKIFFINDDPFCFRCGSYGPAWEYNLSNGNQKYQLIDIRHFILFKLPRF